MMMLPRLQCANALLPILFTDVGIVTFSKYAQLKNAKLPILITDDGISILVKWVIW